MLGLTFTMADIIKTVINWEFMLCVDDKPIVHGGTTFIDGRAALTTELCYFLTKVCAHDATAALRKMVKDVPGDVPGDESSLLRKITPLVASQVMFFHLRDCPIDTLHESSCGLDLFVFWPDVVRDTKKFTCHNMVDWLENIAIFFSAFHDGDHELYASTAPFMVVKIIDIQDKVRSMETRQPSETVVFNVAAIIQDITAKMVLFAKTSTDAATASLDEIKTLFSNLNDEIDSCIAGNKVDRFESYSNMFDMYN